MARQPGPRLSFLATFGLATLALATPGLGGCEVCFSNCIDDAGVAGSDDATTGAGVTSTSGGSSDVDGGPGIAEGAGTGGDTAGGSGLTGVSAGTGGSSTTQACEPADTDDTEGVAEGASCSGMTMPPNVVDMKMVRAGDMVPPPSGHAADTRFLVLRSQGDVCGPVPLAPPDCSEPEEFTLVVVIPPEFQVEGDFLFGDFASETGHAEPELESWINIGGTSCCEVGVLPRSSILEIESIEADGSITGRICGFDWMPGLGHGLSGYIDAPSC